MLPDLHRRRYQEFKQVLEQMQASVASKQDTPFELAVARSRSFLQLTVELRQNFLETQQFFQQQIVSLGTGDLEPVDEPRVRSYQTEMSKQLQLLGIDVTFLQAAQQFATVQQRLKSVGDRIQTLISYCDVLLQLN